MIEHKKPVDKGTGSHELEGEYKIITCRFEKYEIKMKLTVDNRFLEIIEIKINKDFLSHKQRISTIGFHDVDDLYRE